MKNHFKAAFFLVTGHLFFLTMQAQTTHSHKKENFDVREFGKQAIRISPPADRLSLRNMSGIQIIDARADIVNIGLMQKKVVNAFSDALGNAAKNQTEQRITQTPTFIILDDGLQLEAKRFANGSIMFSNNSSLPGILMVIKKLWLSDELNLDGNTHVSGRLAGPNHKDVWTSGVDIKIEFYLDYKGDYYAMYRYDSVITEAMTTSEYASKFVAQAIRLSMQRLPEMDTKITSIITRKKFSMEEIRTHNENEFSLPILKDSILKKGVYMTFGEFKNNNPSQTDFEIKKEKVTDILYIKQPDGTEIVPRDAWGYSNGENAFIKSADNFFLLQRSANAFYIYGAKYIKRSETSSPGGSPSYSSGSGGFYGAPISYSSSSTEIQLEPFQLDWSTGKLY